MRSTLPFQLRVRSHVSSRIKTSTAANQRSIRAAYYRGGTSRGLIINPQDLPSNRKTWPAIFRQLMGSGDPYGRQLDGMGAGVSSLSKICLVEASAGQVRRVSELRGNGNTSKTEGAQKEAHVDYTFVGMGIEGDEVDVAGNCGNMSSAIGPYAYNAGLLPPAIYAGGDGMVTVKIRNTNTHKFIDSTFHVLGGQAAVRGDYAIDGVSGTGSRIKLDFRSPYGSKTGKILPTGRKIDTINGYKVTCVDGANPAVFIRADDIGVDGTILPNDFNKLPNKLDLLEEIRRGAAVAMGVSKSKDDVPRTIPKIGIVSMSATHPVLSGTTLKTSEMDLVVRFISDGQPHRASPLTAALTTAVAARIPGTIVEQLLAPDPVMEDAITIGHSSGRLQVNATMDPTNQLIPLSATVYRTAKRILEGKVYYTRTKDLDDPKKIFDREDKKHSLGIAFIAELKDECVAQPMHKSDEGEHPESQKYDSKSQDGKMKDPHQTVPSVADEAVQSEPGSAGSDYVLRELHELRRLVTQLVEEHDEQKLSSDSAPPVAQNPRRLSHAQKIEQARKNTHHEPSEQGGSPAIEANPHGSSQLRVQQQLALLKARMDNLTHSLSSSSAHADHFAIINNMAPSTSTSSTRSKGNEWHHWAKDLAKRNKGRKKRVEKLERSLQKLQKGATGRRFNTGEAGRLDKWGNLRSQKWT